MIGTIPGLGSMLITLVVRVLAMRIPKGPGPHRHPLRRFGRLAAARFSHNCKRFTRLRSDHGNRPRLHRDNQSDADFDVFRERARFLDGHRDGHQLDRPDGHDDHQQHARRRKVGKYLSCVPARVV